jgi:hypothetical protein
MTPMNHLAAVCCCAGILGALVNSVVFWLAGLFGIISWAGVDLAPGLTLDWLSPRLLWGGLWGLPLTLLFATPRRRRNWIRKGLLFSLLPSAVLLFYYYYPPITEHGLLTLCLATMVPVLLLLFFNALWGAFTGVFTRLLWGRG